MKRLKIDLSGILSAIALTSLLQLSGPVGNLLAAEKAGAKTKNKVSRNKVDETKLTPEVREQMAKMHENMAKCLRSNESLTKCRDEMRKDCEQNIKEWCPMMGRHGRGMRHRMGDGMGNGMMGY
ncbi:MAG: hypothetical protein HQK53_05770 [Oligoflexia bacterium]|nr:hypothetical protein [Oligoflexia bacterium]